MPLDDFRPGPGSDALLRQIGLTGKRVILFVGRMASNKRADLLVEALALVRRSVPDAALLLVGDGQSDDALRANTARIKSRACDLACRTSFASLEWWTT